MEDKKTVYEKFCEFMEKDTKGVEIGIYAVAGLFLGYAYHKKRPVTKFGASSDIPKYFIENKIKQYGRVAQIEPSQTTGPILMVNHKPPIRLPFVTKSYLPVKISGIDINANGYSWLQSVVVDKQIVFIPLSNQSDNADCLVYLIEKKMNMKEEKEIDVGQALLSLGFGQLSSHIEVKSDTKSDVLLKNYYKKLQTIENYAKKRRQGLWRTSLPPLSWPVLALQRIQDNMWSLLTPQSKRLPELVR